MFLKGKAFISSFLHYNSLPDLNKAAFSKNGLDLFHVSPLYSESLKLGEFVIEDYTSSSDYLLQTLSERTSSINTYVILVGILLSGLGLTFQLHVNQQSDLALIVIFVMLISAISHFLFYVRFLYFIVYIYEHTINMHKIREFYFRQIEKIDPEILRIFVFRQKFHALYSVRPKSR